MIMYPTRRFPLLCALILIIGIAFPIAHIFYFMWSPWTYGSSDGNHIDASKRSLEALIDMLHDGENSESSDSTMSMSMKFASILKIGWKMENEYATMWYRFFLVFVSIFFLREHYAVCLFPPRSTRAILSAASRNAIIAPTSTNLNARRILNSLKTNLWILTLIFGLLQCIQIGLYVFYLPSAIIMSCSTNEVISAKVMKEHFCLYNIEESDSISDKIVESDDNNIRLIDSRLNDHDDSPIALDPDSESLKKDSLDFLSFNKSPMTMYDSLSPVAKIKSLFNYMGNSMSAESTQNQSQNNFKPDQNLVQGGRFTFMCRADDSTGLQVLDSVFCEPIDITSGRFSKYFKGAFPIWYILAVAAGRVLVLILGYMFGQAEISELADERMRQEHRINRQGQIMAISELERRKKRNNNSNNVTVLTTESGDNLVNPNETPLASPFIDSSKSNSNSGKSNNRQVSDQM